MPLKHRFVSNKPDGPDTSLVRPSNWNEDHKVEPGITGSVLFVGENQSVSEDNANLFWNNANKRLGIGTNAPSESLHVVGNIKIDDAYKLTWSDVNLYRAGADLLKTDDNLAIGTLTPGSILFAGPDGLISQNNANLFWDNVNKRLGIGTNRPDYILHVVGISSFTSAYMHYNADNSYGGFLQFRKSRGTYSSPTAVLSGDELGYVTFSGHDGSSYRPAAAMLARVDGAPSTNSVPGRIEFFTTTVGATTYLLRVVIKNDGKVGIGTTTPEFLVDSRGDVCVNRTANADSTNTLRDSFNLVLRAAYWTGSASANRDAVIFHRMLSTTPTSEIAFQIAGVDLAMLRSEIADGETALLIRRNVGGTYSVVRVSMGPPDSGGTGYRVLRVPN
ncbi:MAG: hypothetical protein QW692_03035 [Nitrososphaerota archaeon]